MDKIINKAKQALSGHPVLFWVAKVIFGPVTRYNERQIIARKQQVFQKNAREVLMLFINCMEEQEVKYTLAFGSVLGAIREHGFIKHDLDIDIAMWSDDFKPQMVDALERTGFTWLYSHKVDDGRLGREDTFVYQGVRIDVFYFYPAVNQLPYCCDFLLEQGMTSHQRLPRRVEIPYSRVRRKVDFEGMEVYVPDNAEEFCEFRYGADYMTPNPNWRWEGESEHVVEWREKIEVTESIKYPHGERQNIHVGLKM